LNGSDDEPDRKKAKTRISGKSKPKFAATPKAKKSATPKASPAPSPQEKSGKSKGTPTTAQPAEALEAAKSACDQLSQVTPSALFRNTFKSKEIESRVKKGSQALSKLSGAMISMTDDSPEQKSSQAMIAKLENSCMEIPNQKDFFILVGSSNVCPAVADGSCTEMLKIVVGQMDTPTQSSLLMQIGQKLLEALSACSHGRNCLSPCILVNWLVG
jgi:hypothetical protein